MHYKHFDVNYSLFDIPTSTKETNGTMLTSKIFVFWYIVMSKEEEDQLLKWWKAHLVVFLHVSFLNKHIFTSLKSQIETEYIFSKLRFFS